MRYEKGYILTANKEKVRFFIDSDVRSGSDNICTTSVIPMDEEFTFVQYEEYNGEEYLRMVSENDRRRKDLLWHVDDFSLNGDIIYPPYDVYSIGTYVPNNKSTRPLTPITPVTPTVYSFEEIFHPVLTGVIGLNICNPGDICITQSGARLVYKKNQQEEGEELDYPHVLVSENGIIVTRTDEGWQFTLNWRNPEQDDDIVKIIRKS